MRQSNRVRDDFYMVGFVVTMGLFCIIVGFKLNQKADADRLMQAKARAFNCYTIRGTARDIARTDSVMALIHTSRCN